MGAGRALGVGQAVLRLRVGPCGAGLGPRGRARGRLRSTPPPAPRRRAREEPGKAEPAAAAAPRSARAAHGHGAQIPARRGRRRGEKTRRQALAEEAGPGAPRTSLGVHGDPNLGWGQSPSLGYPLPASFPQPLTPCVLAPHPPGRPSGLRVSPVPHPAALLGPTGPFRKLAGVCSAAGGERGGSPQLYRAGAGG